MNKLFPKIFALLLLASPAFAVRIAAPVRVVPNTGSIGAMGAVGAALAAPKSMLAPTLGNSISLNNSLTNAQDPVFKPGDFGLRRKPGAFGRHPDRLRSLHRQEVRSLRRRAATQCLRRRGT